MRIAASALREANPSNYDKVIQSLGGRELTTELARKLAEIPEDDVVGLNKFLRAATEFSTADKISAYWTSSILSGPKTHIRNMIGNAAFALTQFPQRAVRGMVDIGMSKLAGRPQEYYARETIPAAVGFFAGLPDGLRQAAFIVQHGFDVAEASKLELPKIYEFSGGWKNPLNAPGRWLVAADSIAKTMNLRSEMFVLAARQALREGYTLRNGKGRIAEILADPTPAMVEKAADFSKYATFNSSPSNVNQALIKLRESSLILGTNITPLRYISPFVNTPMNILATSLEYSPAGLAKLASAGFKSPEASDIVAKSIIGSLVMTYAARLAMQGKLTGAAPATPNERDNFFRQGKQPFSVRINGRWVSYSQMVGPLALSLSAVAAFHDAFTQRGEVPTEDRIGQAAGVIGKSIVDQSFFKGISSFINAVENPKQYGAKFFSDEASGFVPMSALTRTVAQSMDSTVHDPQGLYESIISGLPVLSKRVPGKLDIFGREQQAEGAEGALAFLPSRMPKDEPRSAVDGELDRLGIFPGKTGNTITIKSHKAVLTREQKVELQRTVGQSMYESLSALFASPEYANLSEEDKQAAAKKLIDQARDAGRAAFIGKNRSNFTFTK